MTTNSKMGSSIIRQFSVTNRDETLIMAEAKDILDLKQQTIMITNNAKTKKTIATMVLVTLLSIGEFPPGLSRRYTPRRISIVITKMMIRYRKMLAVNLIRSKTKSEVNIAIGKAMISNT